MIRLAATGDIHFGTDSAGTLRPHLKHLHEQADLLLIAGDLTRHGDVAEAEVLGAELAGLATPVVAVLGNHDYHLDQQDAVTAALEAAGVTVLECGTTRFEFNGLTIGIAGMKGFCGGFAGACGSAFGEPHMKAFINHTRDLAVELGGLVASLDTDVRVVLLHYSPSEETLEGERLEIYPFLGSYLLSESIDQAGADVVFHGHAHAGIEKGLTPAGITVRNVARHVLGTVYGIYAVGSRQAAGTNGATAPAFQARSPEPMHTPALPSR